MQNIENLLNKPVRYIVDDKGSKVSVIIDIDTFKAMQEALEDFYDNLLMDEVEGEERIPWEDVKESLRQAGKL